MKDSEKQLYWIYQQCIDLDTKSCEAERRACRTHELTDCQRAYLKLIDLHQPLTPGQFARLTCVSKPTVSQIINRFIDEGYLVKKPCSEDRRITYIELTEQGQRAARAEQIARIQIVRRIETRLTEKEVGQLIGLMEKLFNTKEKL